MMAYRLNKLQADPDHVHKCPCGKDKLPICAAKIDAAQFFKAASINRVVFKINRFLDRLQQKTGKDAIAISRSQRAEGFLCTAEKKPTESHTVLPFRRIKEGCEIAKADIFFQ